MRRDAPCAPYDRLTVKVPVYHYGDIAARMRVRKEEAEASIELIGALLDRLPKGDIRCEWQAPAAGAEGGLGIVEGWRGEIVTYVRLGESG